MDTSSTRALDGSCAVISSDLDDRSADAVRGHDVEQCGLADERAELAAEES